MRRKATQSEIDDHKKKVMEYLIRQPAEPKDLYAIMDPDLAYQALVALTFEGKVKSEGLTYYHSSAKPSSKVKTANTQPTNQGKPAEHRLRAKKYRGELNDPTTR